MQLDYFSKSKLSRAYSRRPGLNHATGLSSICCVTRTIEGTDRHNRQAIRNSSDTWTVQLHFSDEFETYCRSIYYLLKRLAFLNYHRFIGISHNMSIPQFGQATHEDLMILVVIGL